MTTYSQNSVPKCPWCDADIEDVHDYKFKFEDEYEEEITCPSCGKNISVTTTIDVTYSTKAIGCEKHTLDFKKGYSHYYYTTKEPKVLLFECTKCRNEFYDWQLSGGKHEKIKKHQYEFVGTANDLMNTQGTPWSSPKTSG